MDQAAFTLICPENLLFPFYVVLDHLVGSIQNRLGRTVVLLQLDDRSFRKIFFIVQNIVDVGTPELVDRLIVITYNTKDCGIYPPANGSAQTVPCWYPDTHPP